MSFMTISHAFLTNIFTIFDKISVEWFTFGPEVTRNEQEKYEFGSENPRFFWGLKGRNYDLYDRFSFSSRQVCFL